VQADEALRRPAGLRELGDRQRRGRRAQQRVVADDIGRYSPQIEAAIYFCCLEALQNVQKYARATSAAVSITVGSGWLSFEIRDDGAGFDPETVPRGAGLQNMADRLDALGGRVDLESAPGAGTTLRGRLPVDVSEAVVPEAVA